MSVGRICYVVTSGGLDIYSAMTRLSVASVRISNPDVHVAVVCDSVTNNALRLASDRLQHEVDEWIVHNSEFQVPVARNRDLKTRLRLLLDGPFLFVDSDTMIRKSILGVFSIKPAIAAALNNSADKYSSQIVAPNADIIQKMGWQIRDDAYFNAGVVFYNDTPVARAFSRQWHMKWLESYNQTDCIIDQPAFNSSICDLNVHCEKLDAKYNSQVIENPLAAKDAILWHYFASRNDFSVFTFSTLLDSALKNQIIDTVALRKCMSRNHPFKDASWDSDMGWQVQRFASELVNNIRNPTRLAASIKRLNEYDPKLNVLVQDVAFNRMCINHSTGKCGWLLLFMLRDQPVAVIKRVLRRVRFIRRGK
jgi:hypothetical protein